jgi:hypothetical protein
MHIYVYVDLYTRVERSLLSTILHGITSNETVILNSKCLVLQKFFKTSITFLEKDGGVRILRSKEWENDENNHYQMYEL